MTEQNKSKVETPANAAPAKAAPAGAPEQKDEFGERLVNVRRTTKVVKGGKNFSFSALVVVGDRNGHVGLGIGKANEMADAIRKAGEHARRNVVPVSLYGSTITHMVTYRFGAAKIMMRPASAGTGVIAGGGMRPVLELAGIKDVFGKSLGAKNAVNVVKATFEALTSMKTRKSILEKRDRVAL